MSISTQKLDQFIKYKGYEIVKQVKRGKHKGKWRNISEASRRTQLSRPTIYTILEAYPEPPSKTKPKYVDTFENSEGYRLLTLTYKKTISPSEWQQTVRDCLIAWRKIGGSSDNKKDPISWSIDDWREIWNLEEFYSEEAGGVLEQHATRLRRMMYSCDQAEALRKFKGKKPPQGKHRQWFLHDHEIKELVSKVEDKDTLLFIELGIATGARASALLRIRVEWIDFHSKTIKVFEPKVKTYAYKYPPYCVFELLRTYIEEKNLKPKDRVFPRNYDFYVKAMKEAGEKANLKKTITTHILKHTYVSQAHAHGVSAETVVEQVKTELRTLMKYYQAKNEAKMRAEMQGSKFEHIPFHQWLGTLSYFFKARYQEL